MLTMYLINVNLLFKNGKHVLVEWKLIKMGKKEKTVKTEKEMKKIKEKIKLKSKIKKSIRNGLKKKMEVI